MIYIVSIICATAGFAIGFLIEYFSREARFVRSLNNDAIAIRTMRDDDNNIAEVSFIFDENLLNDKNDD